MDSAAEWAEARAVAWMRDLNRCAICGHRAEEGHHRVIRGMGGRKNDPDQHSPERLLSLCRRHHEHVHRHRSLAADLGYFVLAGEDAEQKAVWYQDEMSWFQLSTRGTRLMHPNWMPPEVYIA